MSHVTSSGTEAWELLSDVPALTQPASSGFGIQVQTVGVQNPVGSRLPQTIVPLNNECSFKTPS